MPSVRLVHALELDPVEGQQRNLDDVDFELEDEGATEDAVMHGFVGNVTVRIASLTKRDILHSQSHMALAISKI